MKKMSDDLKKFIDRWNDDNLTMLVHTSGSTGKPKGIYVSKKMMIESAKMTINALGLDEQTIALLNLPIKYISGQMMVIRSIVGNFRLIEGPVSSHPLKDLNKVLGKDNLITFASMTPMQVYNTSLVSKEWDSLAKIKTLIIGGGAISNELEDKLQTISTEVYATYGMTETLSHIALRHVNGPYKSNYFIPFEGVKITTDLLGRLHVDAPRVCAEHLITNDLVEIANNENDNNREEHRPLQFRFIGRLDNVINSGGVKIHIEEVEQKIIDYYRQNKRNLKEFDFAITFISDTTFGEMVVLLDSTASLTIDQFGFLDSIERPKKILKIDRIPLTSTNKINRKVCHQTASDIATKYLQS